MSTTIPKTMRAARVLRQGPAAFEVVEIPCPEPGPGQVLIKVESCGVNFSDVKRRRGDAYPFETSFPFIPGGEIAGQIVAHGPGVDGPPVGAKVFALAGSNGFGGYAQFALSYAATAVPIPEGLSFDVASIVTIAGATAKLILRDVARLAPEETIFIPAATGGVGSFAIQIARRMAAGKIIAGVGDPAKKKRAIELGAHEVVVYDASNWPEQVRKLTGGRGVDVAMEANGGSCLEETLRCLSPFGRLVVFGAASGRSGMISEKALEAVLYAPAPNQTLVGFNVGGWFMERPMVAGAALTELVTDILRGHMRSPSVSTLRLEEAGQAHQLLEARQSSGKMVIKPWA